MWCPRVVVSMLALAVTTAVTAPMSAWASYPSGSVGHDVSYPQCTSSGASSTTVGGLQSAFELVLGCGVHVGFRAPERARPLHEHGEPGPNE